MEDLKRLEEKIDTTYWETKGIALGLLTIAYAILGREIKGGDNKDS